MCGGALFGTNADVLHHECEQVLVHVRALRTRYVVLHKLAAYVMSLEGLVHAGRCPHLYGPGGCGLTKTVIANDGRIVARL